MTKNQDKQFFKELERSESRTIADDERAAWRGTLKYAKYGLDCAVSDLSRAFAKAFSVSR